MPTNRVLTDADREKLADTMRTMFQFWPELYNRKIADSMVQFAFCYDTALLLGIQAALDTQKTPYVLAAGSHEDIATECLKLNGFVVVGVDPVINCDLHTFRLRTSKLFNLVVSASVLEHAENDEEFIADCCDLLLPGGFGIFTMDFKDDWSQGQRVPYTSRRFYTTHDLTIRLPNVLAAHNCELVDEPDYSGKDRFSWENINYSFASFVFRKKELENASVGDKDDGNTSGRDDNN